MRRLCTAVVALQLALATGASATDSAAESTVPATPEAVSTRDARKLVAAFDGSLRLARRIDVAAHRREAELDAVRVLAKGAHERVARRLAEAVGDESVLLETRTIALGAVAQQGDHGRAQAGRLADWLGRAAGDAAEDLRNGRIGVPLDPRTGDTVTETPEAEEALREGEARARLLAAGVSALRAFEHPPKRPADVLRPFLQSPFDELAVAAIEAAGAWDARDLVTEVAFVLRMYPRENRWETGAVTHLNGTNASAKAAWMRLFGHPLKRRARPAVHRAAVACLSGWASQPIPDPAACDAWLSKQRKRPR